MTNLLSGHLEDCSTPQYFCFSIRCEVCGDFGTAAAYLFQSGRRRRSTARRRSSTTPSTSASVSGPG